jgi:hypothetical protein
MKNWIAPVLTAAAIAIWKNALTVRWVALDSCVAASDANASASIMTRILRDNLVKIEGALDRIMTTKAPAPLLILMMLLK